MHMSMNVLFIKPINSLLYGHISIDTIIDNKIESKLYSQLFEKKGYHSS